MSAKIRKATENSLYSFEQYTKNVFGIWFTQMHKRMKENEKTYKEKLIKTCLSQFSKDYDFDEDEVDDLHNSLKDACSKHKLGKLEVTCPDFVVNHSHDKNDEENVKKDGELSEYKKFLFEIKKKKEPTERKLRQAVTTYQLWQSQERSSLKKDGKNTKEIREILKNKWVEFKEDSDKFSNLEKKAKEMKELPNKKPTNTNGLGRTAYHIYQGYEKKAFLDNNPDADSDEVSEHISEAWKKVKMNPVQYKEYLELAEEKKEIADEEKAKKAKKAKKDKKLKDKKERKKNKKNKKKSKKDDDEVDDDEVEDDVIDNEDEIKVVKAEEVLEENEDVDGILNDDDSEAELNLSDVDHSDDDSDLGVI